jgi:DNA-binding NtrC family response regulator
LITDDSALVQAVGGVFGSLADLGLRTVATVQNAFSHLQHSNLALVLAHLGKGRGFEEVADLLRRLAAGGRAVATLVISDHRDAEHALALLRLGAADHLTRPLDLQRLAYLSDVLTLRARAEQVRSPKLEAQTQKSALLSPGITSLGEVDPFLFVPSSAVGQLMDQVQRVAPQDTTLVLTGETGTGKTRLARLIHELSPRNAAPFLAVHCGALSASLIESELFGHVQGAFTGADRERIGKFAAAGSGTLLLDDIDALPLELQAKLLRVVEERVFEPVGANRHCKLAARVIAATNRNLEEEVAGGRFRSDLYYRLNVVAFYLPPLRERHSAIPALAEHFLQRFVAANGSKVQGFAPITVEILQSHDWPGNIRELRNVLERAVALCAGEEIQPEDLPEMLRRKAEARLLTSATQRALDIGHQPSGVNADDAMEAVVTLHEVKEDVEFRRIAEALKRHNNNRLRTALELGISRMTLYKKMRHYGMVPST